MVCAAGKQRRKQQPSAAVEINSATKCTAAQNMRANSRADSSNSAQLEAKTKASAAEADRRTDGPMQ